MPHTHPTGCPHAMIVAIEHMEDGMSRWMLEEYKEAARVARSMGWSLVITGVADQRVQALLTRAGIPHTSQPACRMLRGRLSILLDPEASKPLEPWEAHAAQALVIGGIMGDHPPRGRTRLLTHTCPGAARRHLGPHQLSIDGALKVAALIARGARLREIPLAVAPVVEVETPLGRVEIELPFAYPLREGRPWIAPGVVELLRRGIMWDERGFDPSLTG